MTELTQKFFSIEEGTIPFPRPLIKKAALAFKQVQYPNYPASTRKVLACENGRLFEEGIELKDARFGKVHRIYALQRIHPTSEVYIRTGEKLVVKKISKQLVLHNRDRCENPLSEIGALQYLLSVSQEDHFQQFFGYYDCYGDFDTIYLITPFFDSGDLLDVISIRQKIHSEITIYELKEMFQQVSEQVQFLHSHGIVHRDLSLENVLYDKKTNVYSVIDFGMSVRLKETQQDIIIHGGNNVDCNQSTSSSSMMDEEDFEETFTENDEPFPNEYSKFYKISQYIVCGKNQYIAPELWRHEKELQYMKADIWSLGIIFFMMFVLQAPFEIAKLQDGTFRFFQEKQDMYALLEIMLRTSDFSTFTREEHQLIDLLDRMLKVNPEERITISEVLAHPFFY
jgi:serine/threonine protein kinase